ncbi:MAG TPA: type II toxin-antitoxin system VapC family toxin [Thermomicrobiales bacterium]|nr:type II toxin-antitoxin system VapC family toxin [Thermomicrobiales bacterium]
MIFLDTNIFLRLLTKATTGATQQMKIQVRTLFNDIQSSRVEAMTSEVVLHEVFYILTSKRQYGVPSADAIAMLRPLLRFRSLRLGPGDKEIVLRALEIWEQNLKLEFADSVIAARCEVNGWELATFDETLGSVPHITRWQPA